jgi:hypothetical protein
LETATPVPSQTWFPVPFPPMFEQGRLVVRVPISPSDQGRYFRLHRLGP